MSVREWLVQGQVRSWLIAIFSRTDPLRLMEVDLVMQLGKVGEIVQRLFCIDTQCELIYYSQQALPETSYFCPRLFRIWSRVPGPIAYVTLQLTVIVTFHARERVLLLGP